jgi:hypothetical protein
LRSFCGRLYQFTHDRNAVIVSLPKWSIVMAADVYRLYPGEAPTFGIGPHSIQTEQAILGAVLANNKRFVQAESLRPDHFIDPMNAQLFAEIARRIIGGGLADAVTLKDWIVANTDPPISQVEASRYLTGIIQLPYRENLEPLDKYRERWGEISQDGAPSLSRMPRCIRLHRHLRKDKDHAQQGYLEASSCCLGCDKPGRSCSVSRCEQCVG